MTRYEILYDDDCLPYLSPIGEGEIIAPGEAEPFPAIYLAADVHQLLEAIKASLTGKVKSIGRYSEESRRWVDSDTLRLVEEALVAS